MNAALRLMWKEYRVLRGFWMSLAAFGLGCDGLIFLFVDNAEDRLAGLVTLAAVLPACFALGAGATLFALEREESTRDLLRYLPLTSLRVFASKVWVALSGTLLLTLMLFSLGLAGLWLAFGESAGASLSREDSLTGAVQVTAFYAIIVLQVLGWAVFFSLRSARPLLAAFLGALGAVGCMSLVQFVARSNDWFSPQRSFLVPLVHAATTVVVWLVDVRLGNHWLHGRRVALRGQQKGTAGPAPLKRLLWQEWRGSRRLLAALFALGLLLPAVQWADPYSGGLGVVPAVGLVLALFGSCVFLGDQGRLQFRYFAERGVSGRSVWFGRLLFWIGSAAVLAAILLIGHLLTFRPGVSHLSASVNPAAWGNTQFVLSWFAIDLCRPGTLPSDGTIQWLTGLSGYVVWLSLAFGAGQLCSMLFRSGLLAAVCGVMLAGVLLAWAALMHVLEIPWWWSVAPLAAALFAATWLRSDGWLLERRRFSAWLPSITALAVPAVAVLIAFPTYRVLEIPNVDVQKLRTQAAPLRTKANETVARLFSMGDQVPLSGGTSLHRLSAEASPQERTWLAEHGASLEAVVEAASGLSADATVEAVTAEKMIPWQRITALLIRYGQLAEGDGALDKAWTRYLAVLHIARLMRTSTVLGETLGDEMERPALSQLPRWGARKGQTADRLTAAVAVLQRLDVQDGLLTDLVWREYQGNLTRIDEIKKEPGSVPAIYGLCAKWAPWEFARARRLLRYQAFLDLQEAGAADRAFGTDTPSPPPSLSADRIQANLLFERTLLQALTPVGSVIESRRLTLCYRRATQLALAIQRGEMPAKLEELSKDFEPLRPDPYTNQPFSWFPWGLRLSVRPQNGLTIPAKTPLLYSPAKASLLRAELNQLNSLRRKSPDDPVRSVDEPVDGEGGGAALGPAPAPPATGMPAAAGPSTPRPAAAASPTRRVEPAVLYLEGLAFPVPTGEEDTHGE